jgi:hypothetical protein
MQKRGENKKKICPTFFCSHKYQKIENYFTFELVKNKIFEFGPIFKELYNFLPKKLALKNIGLGFVIRDPEKTYSGSRIRGQKGTGSRIQIRNIGKLEGKECRIRLFWFMQFLRFLSFILMNVFAIL